MDPLDIFRILVIHQAEFSVHTVGNHDGNGGGVTVVFTVPTNKLKSIMFADLTDAHAQFTSEGCMFLSNPLEV